MFMVGFAFLFQLTNSNPDPNWEVAETVAALEAVRDQLKASNEENIRLHGEASP